MMPDHLHAILTLPMEDTNYGKRGSLIKAHFSKAVQKWYDESLLNPSRRDRRKTTIWPRRFLG